MLLDASGQPLPPPLPPPMLGVGGQPIEPDQTMVSSSGHLMQQQMVDAPMYDTREQAPLLVDPSGQPIMSQHENHSGPPVMVDSSGQPIPAHQVTSNGNIHQLSFAWQSL